jgi:hypothetical protein
MIQTWRRARDLWCVHATATTTLRPSNAKWLLRLRVARISRRERTRGKVGLPLEMPAKHRQPIRAW